MNNQKINLEICKKLTEYFTNNPDLRFWQGLYNVNIIKGVLNDNDKLEILDDYNISSEYILKHLTI